MREIYFEGEVAFYYISIEAIEMSIYLDIFKYNLRRLHSFFEGFLENSTNCEKKTVNQSQLVDKMLSFLCDCDINRQLLD